MSVALLQIVLSLSVCVCFQRYIFSDEVGSILLCSLALIHKDRKPVAFQILLYSFCHQFQPACPIIRRNGTCSPTISEVAKVSPSQIYEMLIMWVDKGHIKVQSLSSIYLLIWKQSRARVYLIYLHSLRGVNIVTCLNSKLIIMFCLLKMLPKRIRRK